MKILLLNWRDIKNPNSGGAELATCEILKRFAAGGHKIIQISAGFQGAKKSELIDKVQIIRLGNYFSVHFLAFFYYNKFLKNKVDVVIDQIHGVPFFTPLFVKELKIAYIHEVAGSVWFYQWPFPVSLIGFLIEKLYFKIYSRITFVTVSKSSRQDLIKYGLNPKKIFVIKNGLTIPKKLKLDFSKNASPTLSYLGRITWSKRIEDQILAIAKLKPSIPKIRFWIIGKGDKNCLNYLKNEVKKLGLEKNVKFFGFVPEKEKYELLSKSWAIVATSVKEGFGLSILEAAYCQTPAVVYKVNGLKDIVINNKTGLICQTNSPLELARNINYLILNHKIRSELGVNAKNHSKLFNWNKSYNLLEKIIHNHLLNKNEAWSDNKK